MESAMNEEPRASWDNAFDLLVQWHEERRPEVGRAVLRFIESELRLMTPALVRRSWPEDLVEDALRDFLVRLVEHHLLNKSADTPVDCSPLQIAVAFVSFTGLYLGRIEATFKDVERRARAPEVPP